MKLQSDNVTDRKENCEKKKKRKKRELWSGVSADTLAGMILEIYYPPWATVLKVPDAASY